LDATLAAFEHWLADNPLQSFHLHADRRLRARDGLPGFCEILAFGHGKKGPEQVTIQRKGHSRSTSINIMSVMISIRL
jgi:hypothetical protein